MNNEIKQTETPIWKYEDYNDWSRLLAKNHTLKELEAMLGKSSTELKKSTKSHLNAIEKSTSMQGNSQARAQSGNSVTGNYEKKYAVENAIEIYKYYPERTLEGK